MAEPRVETVMTRSLITVTADVSFKQVACAILACDLCAVPVVADGRLIGVVGENDVLANLEFHGGRDPLPLVGRTTARRRRHKALAGTALELMSRPVAISASASISEASQRLADPAVPALCVIDRAGRLLGLLTRRDLLAVYKRTDDDIAADVRAAVDFDRMRPTRTPAELTVRVTDGAVALDGTVTYRSQVEHANFVVSRIPGVVSVQSNLRYDIDDMLVTGF